MIVLVLFHVFGLNGDFTAATMNLPALAGIDVEDVASLPSGAFGLVVPGVSSVVGVTLVDGHISGLVSQVLIELEDCGWVVLLEVELEVEELVLEEELVFGGAVVEVVEVVVEVAITSQSPLCASLRIS